MNFPKLERSKDAFINSEVTSLLYGYLMICVSHPHLHDSIFGRSGGGGCRNFGGGGSGIFDEQSIRSKPNRV